MYPPNQGGMRTTDRGSTTGAASWTDRVRSERAAPKGRAKRVNPPLTAIFKLRACTEVRAFCLYVSPKPRGDENHRPGFDNWRSQLDRPGAQRTGCPEGASKASQSPLTAIFKLRACTEVRAFCLYVSPKLRGDENHRPGFDNWRSQLDRPGAQRTGCPEGASKASQSPPHRHI
ncbi:Uncharacterised protein [Salmonella enterica]|nr:Uncharacterised protein [Salmonella enterica]